MIGFIMMIGVIVNHAILLVAAARSAEARGTLWRRPSAQA